MKKKAFFGTILLTISGLICRLIGFFYRIFLSHAIGAEGLGIYQLIVPIYHLSYAISTAGIQTALSRLIASATAKREHAKALLTFLIGTTTSFILSLSISLLLQKNSPYLANHFLGDSSCIPLLNLLAYTLPFGALHGCVIGWFMGKKQIHIPAFMQIMEELIRLAATWICYLYLISSNRSPNANIAVSGLLISEIISVIISIFFVSFHKNTKIQILDLSYYKSCTKELFFTSFPLTLNRIALNLLHSAEAILIPLSLEKYALTRSEALETLGTISGMALPLVLFPTAIVNALSSILLPTISENFALKNKQYIQRLVKKSLLYIFLMGMIFMVFFFLTGKQLGVLLYNNADAGYYITLLSTICPFLFCDIILASIMNGLGQTFLCFFVNLGNMVFRIFCIYFLIPHTGIYGYLTGLIGGEFFCSIISILIIFILIFRKQPIDK